MHRKVGLLVALGLLLGVVSAGAQSTGMPSFNAPYRAFSMHEFGGTLSFPEGDRTGLEGQYKFGYKTLDIGVRGGILDEDAPGDDQILLGVTGRVRVVTHTEQFPFDGAFITGIGTGDFDAAIIPIGLSLGRRLDFEDSPLSIVPYAQPTLWAVFDDNDFNDTIQFGLGLGADFRFSNTFDVRASFGVGDVEGFSVSAVWVR